MVETLQNAPPAAGATEPIILPANSLPQTIRIGKNSKRAWVEASTVTLGDGATVTRIEADTIQAGYQNRFGIAIARLTLSAGWWLSAKTIVAPTLNLFGDLRVDTLVTKDAEFGPGGQIDTMYLLPEGKAVFGSKSTIGHLVVGPRVKRIHLGEASTVHRVSAVAGTAEISGDNDVNVLEESRFEATVFASGLQEVLRKATKNTGSVSAPR